MILWWYFVIAAVKTLENIQENICSSHLTKLHNYSLQPTTGLKPPLQILFWKCSEGKGCSKILKISKHLCKNCLFFSKATGLQSKISAYNKTDSKKSFLLVFWDSWKYLKKRYIMESFYQGKKITIYNLNPYKKSPHAFFRGCSEKILFQIFQKIPWETYWWSSFKQLKLSNLSPITILKTDSITNASCECS